MNERHPDLDLGSMVAVPGRPGPFVRLSEVAGGRDETDEVLDDVFGEVEPEPEPELGLVATIIAVPLAPFVALWEGGRVVVTRAIPAAGRWIAQLLPRLGRLVLVPFRILLRALAAGGRRVAAVLASWIRSLGRGVRAVVRRLWSAAARLWRIVTWPGRAIGRLLGRWLLGVARLLGRGVVVMAKAIAVPVVLVIMAVSWVVRGVAKVVVRLGRSLGELAAQVRRLGRVAWGQLVRPFQRLAGLATRAAHHVGQAVVAVRRSLGRPLRRAAGVVALAASSVARGIDVGARRTGRVLRAGVRAAARPIRAAARPIRAAGGVVRGASRATAMGVASAASRIRIAAAPVLALGGRVRVAALTRVTQTGASTRQLVAQIRRSRRVAVSRSRRRGHRARGAHDDVVDRAS